MSSLFERISISSIISSFLLLIYGSVLAPATLGTLAWSGAAALLVALNVYVARRRPESSLKRDQPVDIEALAEDWEYAEVVDDADNESRVRDGSTIAAQRLAEQDFMQGNHDAKHIPFHLRDMYAARMAELHWEREKG